LGDAASGGPTPPGGNGIRASAIFSHRCISACGIVDTRASVRSCPKERHPRIGAMLHHLVT
jgi:hypothetical protein